MARGESQTGMNTDELIRARYEWAMEHRAASRLRAMLHDRGALIYGAGGYGRQVAASLHANGYRVQGFIDGNARPGQEIDGLPVLGREAVDAQRAGEAVLVMAINNFRTPIDEVADWARKAGFAETVFVPELPDLVDPGLGNYWQASRALPLEQSAAIGRVRALLADEVSRAVFDGLIAYRTSGQPEDHPAVDRDRQYFPADLPLGKEAIAVIDGGAFPGDLLETASKAKVRLATWYAFEPDRANFRHLAAFVKARAADLGEAVLFPCGVGAETGVITFAAGQADASHAVDPVAHADVEVVPVVRVDDVLTLDRLDMVKLDIEGFEAGALDGMADLLRRHRPRLAIAVYHKPSDLWELPLKIDAMVPGGRYALRQHGYNGYDTVLYVDWS